MNVWVVVSIGCIECGEKNVQPVLGVYHTEEEAREAVDRYWRDYCNMANVRSDDGLSLDGSEFQVRTQQVEL